jgi:lipopolysaccharide transport system permease protein
VYNLLIPIWKNKDFILTNVKREFESKYKNSLLGGLWAIINPVAMVAVYTLIFSEVMRTKIDGIDNSFGYSIYLCSGILTWALFAEIIQRSINSFIENANLIKKVNFPKICLAAITILNALVNFGIVFFIFIFFLVLSGNFPGTPILFIFPLVVLLVLFAIGLGITLGVLNVFFRDIGQFSAIFMTFWFWLTPIVYPAALIQEKMPWLIDWNPMTPLMIGFQSILLNHQAPDFRSLIVPIVCTAILCLIALHLYRKRVGEIVDEL